jgi:uncharacterized lipoprotein YddW (UPF0748 family)
LLNISRYSKVRTLRADFLFLPLCLLLVMAQLAVADEPAVKKTYQLRAAWIVTAFGIDWPKTLNPDSQKASLEAIFKNLKEKKYNAVFFQVRIRGDVMFKSQYEPYATVMTGTLGQSPDYDPLAFAIQLSRKYGLEFHAWFNTFIVSNRSKAKVSAGVPHIWQSHPDWVPKLSGTPAEADEFIDPSNEAAKQHLRRVAMEVVRNYDIDGFQFDDYMRYPAKDYPDAKAYEQHNPQHLSLADWRRENINSFVRAFYDEATQLKPYLKVGVTPIGVYERLDDTPAMSSYTDVYQDSRAWLREKKCDYLAPQVYFHIGKTTPDEEKNRKFNPAFEKLVADWTANNFGRHIYIGIGAYKPTVKAELKDQIAVVAVCKAEGLSMYPYQSIKDDAVFNDYALIPPMPWKSSKPPVPPTDVSLSPLTNGNVTLTWKTTAETRWVNVYRNKSGVYHLAMQFVSSETTSISASAADRFAVTSIDKFGNESVLLESGVVEK